MTEHNVDGKPIILQEHGTVFRTVDFSPEKDRIKPVDRHSARESFASFVAEQALDDAEEPRHPFMHKTEIIHYAMVLDDTEILATPRDVTIKRGTNHAWSNRSDLADRIVFVLIDGKSDGTVTVRKFA